MTGEPCVYAIAPVADRNPVKVGHSVCFDKRLKDIQSTSPVELCAIGCVVFETVIIAQKVERRLHRFFSDRRRHNEWFDFHSDPLYESDFIELAKLAAQNKLQPIQSTLVTESKMRKDDAIEYTGSIAALAKILGCSRGTIYAWPDVIPENWAWMIEAKTRGGIRVNPDVYKLDNESTTQ